MISEFAVHPPSGALFDRGRIGEDFFRLAKGTRDLGFWRTSLITVSSTAAYPFSLASHLLPGGQGSLVVGWSLLKTTHEPRWRMNRVPVLAPSLPSSPVVGANYRATKNFQKNPTSIALPGKGPPVEAL